MSEGLARSALEHRLDLLAGQDTDAYLWIDRHHDGFPAVRVELLGDVALALHFVDDDVPLPADWLAAWQAVRPLRSVYRQWRPRRGAAPPASPVVGGSVDPFEVHEHGLRYLIDLEASPTSSGLFLDQRETRAELLSGELAGRSVLNAFGHTGSFSVAAAAAGAETLTLDLSRRYLDWAAENLRRNGHDPSDHDFVYGDALDWMGRFARKARTFDLVIVDPPSSSTTKSGRRWTVARDLHDLVAAAARVTAPDGRIYVSTNLRKMTPRTFRAQVVTGLSEAGRDGSISPRGLPGDHRVTRDDPGYLKAAWVQLDG